MSKVKVPKYTLGEEITNSVTHGVGALLGLVALVLSVIMAVHDKSKVAIVAATIYGVSMIVMYMISCIYHALSPNLKAKKVFRVLDHCDIYVYIAGCYTPFCISLIGGKIGWILFIVIWICAVIGILLNAINIEKYKWLSFLMYLIMGWMIVFSFDSLARVLPINGFYFLVGGGVVYTLGAVIYLIGSKKKYFHSIFHFFVLAGSILQFFAIFLYAL